MKWISINRKQPGDFELVLVTNEISHGISLACFSKSTGLFTEDNGRNGTPLWVTHWLDIPDTPNRIAILKK